MSVGCAKKLPVIWECVLLPRVKSWKNCLKEKLKWNWESFGDIWAEKYWPIAEVLIIFPNPGREHTFFFGILLIYFFLDCPRTHNIMTIGFRFLSIESINGSNENVTYTQAAAWLLALQSGQDVPGSSEIATQSKMVLWRADGRHQVTLVITPSGYVSGYGSSAECDNARRPLCLVTETRRERNTTLWWKADLHLVCRLPCL